jgi:hypothetical protein
LDKGGVRVPGVLEWLAKLKKPASTSVVSVTTDFLPVIQKDRVRGAREYSFIELGTLQIWLIIREWG